MRSIIMFAAAAFLSVSALVGFVPHTASAADELDEKRVMEIVEKMLRERPEIIVEALTAYQEKQELAKKERQQEMLSSNADALFKRQGDPFIGNANAKVTIVEFFDYRCGYCKRVLNDVVAVIQANPDVKIVFKEFPILGEASVLATQVSLAVNAVAPAKYGEFHKKVMSGRGSVDKASLLRIASALGIDTAAVEAKMESGEILTAIRENYQLAEKLGIRGTPAFVVGDQVVPGAVDRATLEKLIAEQRG